MRTDTVREDAEINAEIDGQTLCSAFAGTVARNPDGEALTSRDAHGVWHAITWREYRERVRRISLGLRSIGFGSGDFAVILCRNRPEHVIADMSIVHAGGTSVSLYNTLSPEQIAYIAGHCEARVAFVEDEAFLERLLKARSDLPALEHVVVVDPRAAGTGGAIALDELEQRGAAQDQSLFDGMWQAVRPDDLMNLIYTSGTTGPPKGVMNTHRNVLWNVASLSRWFDPGDRVISYLPLAHAADRFLSYWQGAVRGFTTYYCPDIAQIGQILADVRPTFFGAVPRVWEKLHAAINAGLAREPDPAKKAMLEKAIEAGRAASRARQRGEQPPDVSAYEPVFGSLRGKLGLDRATVFFTGAAPTPMEVLEFFDAIGVGISEVWGMSELSAVATMNPVGALRLGSIGRALPGVELRTAEDGELLIKAGLTMRGYYKDAEKTAETIDEDGWLHTGDVARVDEDGYWYVVDRKKELIITAGGKNISPANLESLLKEHPLIGQACVIGDNKPYLAALIVLDAEGAPAWAAQNGLTASTIADLAAEPRVAAEIEHAIAAVNERVARVENVRRWKILAGEWTPESDELTPTMKLKRRVIHERYAAEIAALYA